MKVDSSEPHSARTTLQFADAPPILLESDKDLKAAYAYLPMLLSGQTATLSRGPRHFVKATRRGDFWSAVYRKGGWWTYQAFTADMTTAYSERLVQERRLRNSILKSFLAKFRGPPAEYGLATSQIETVFHEFYVNRRFSLPTSGA